MPAGARIRRAKPCPCINHRGEHVAYSTWQRHAGQLARGVLERWSGDDAKENVDYAPEPVAVAQEPDDAKAQMFMERAGRESYNSYQMQQP